VERYVKLINVSSITSDVAYIETSVVWGLILLFPHQPPPQAHIENIRFTEHSWPRLFLSFKENQRVWKTLKL
jgi:hypothetical protein